MNKKIKTSEILEKILDLGRKIIPKSLFRAGQPIYHFLLAIAGAIIYRFPAKKLVVIGVTGTKGKSTTVELVNSILEAAGKKTAIASTIRYKIGDKEWRNMFKMTLRGRFFTQSFLRRAVNSGCTHAIIEISSEGVPQSRHRFLFLDALIFTNLAPEHIESHGSYANYVKAKLAIAKELEKGGQKKSFSSESPRVALSGSTGLSSQTFLSGPAIIANIDDKEGERFLALNIKNKIPYSLHDAIGIKTDERGSSFQLGKLVVHSKLPGIFNISNMLGAIAYAKFAGISDTDIKTGLEKISFVRGRMEKIKVYPNSEARDQDFDVVVDYAHTPDSLRAVYETYAPRLTKSAPRTSTSSQKNTSEYYIIGVLGNTGGGRDTWKRKVMGEIADEYCDQIILTNEDPYDEDPMKIIAMVKEGIKNKPCEIIIDRRAAINKALRTAYAKASSATVASEDGKVKNEKVAVLITGKGTDPYIMEAHGKKTPWDDATVVREELKKVLG